MAGHAFLPHLGIEDDETLFVDAILHPRAELYSLRLGHSHVPIMLMTYLGALKALIYGPLFRWFGTGVRVLREPMLLAGVASLYLFFRLLRRVAGARAACIGCALLAVDSAYLLTVCFDWGPVALQHLLLIGGVLLAIGFFQDGSGRRLAAGGFLLGLALWDKALAVWLLSGLGIAAILTFPRQVFAALTRRNVAIFAAGFLLGALPLLIYNAGHHWVTFTGNFQRDTTPGAISGKFRMLVNTGQGDGLFGWMIDEDWQTPAPHAPKGALAVVSARISALAGHPRRHLLVYAFGLALLLAPLARGTALRTILFAVIAMAVAWIQMAINANTGGSVHHTVLLWPLPQVVIAVSFASASRRLGRAGMPALAAVLAVAVLSGALVINEYYAVMLRDGGAQSWTDAIYPLSGYLKTVPAPAVICLDWGILDPLRLLDHGRLPLEMRPDSLARPEMTEGDRAYVAFRISDPANVFIAHTKDYEFFPGAAPNLARFAAQSGYTRQTVAVIPDSYGRPVYEVYRFAATALKLP
ncbi:MAG: ArnT family glycosyltransferase [Bryobacteraceae bacterium]